jgi:hypothetical protein
LKNSSLPNELISFFKLCNEYYYKGKIRSALNVGRTASFGAEDYSFSRVRGRVMRSLNSQQFEIMLPNNLNGFINDIDGGKQNVSLQRIEKFDCSVLDLYRQGINSQTDWVFIIYAYFSDLLAQIDNIDETGGTHNDAHLGNILYRYETNGNVLSLTDIGHSSGGFNGTISFVLSQFCTIFEPIRRHLKKIDMGKYNLKRTADRRTFLFQMRSETINFIKRNDSIERIAMKSCQGNAPLFDDIYHRIDEMKAHMQKKDEEMQKIDEEMQKIDEEMQKIDEEMQKIDEEMQKIDEEMKKID